MGLSIDNEDLDNQIGDCIKFGSSYLLKEPNTERAIELLKKMDQTGESSLFITRTHPDEVVLKHSLDSSVVWLTASESRPKPHYEVVSDLEVLKGRISNFIRKNHRSVVVLDRTDYLINLYGFNEMLKLVYSVNDWILMSDSVFLLNVNPATLSDRELSLLSQEMPVIERQKTEMESQLGDDLHEIIGFVNQNIKCSFKDVSKAFSITKTTTRKRLNKLEERNIICIRKNGRNKIIRLTDFGKTLL